jgi:hypothetical protein
MMFNFGLNAFDMSIKNSSLYVLNILISLKPVIDVTRMEFNL